MMQAQKLYALLQLSASIIFLVGKRALPYSHSRKGMLSACNFLRRTPGSERLSVIENIKT